MSKPRRVYAVTYEEKRRWTTHVQAPNREAASLWAEKHMAKHLSSCQVAIEDEGLVDLCEMYPDEVDYIQFAADDKGRHKSVVPNNAYACMKDEK